KGEGMPANLAASAQWMRRAADQGDRTAQFNLGVMYSSGRGIPKDLVQAYMWTELAASSGETNSVKLLDSLQKLMTADQISQARQRVREWKPIVLYSWSIR